LVIVIEIAARAKQGSPHNWKLSKEAHHAAKCLSFSNSIKCSISSQDFAGRKQKTYQSQK
jgi:hypothetical protein